MEDQNEQQNKIFVTGMPVSGKPWKKLSKKTMNKDAGTKGVNKSWKEKQKIKQLADRRKAKIREFEAKQKQKKDQLIQQIKSNRKQKEFNKFNSQKMELIKDSKKIKKWNKKARQ